MEKQQTLLKKYESLVNEWNTTSMVCAVSFSASIIGLALGLIFNNIPTTVTMLVIMVIFAIFEYRAREDYVGSKKELEEEMFKLAGLKVVKIKEVVKKGIWG